ncbi:MAG: hypothetical protein COA78_09150 [Blastopirellula sp.]|nr:MAG: hypothetical protein COA78_09150 [Blastopirellula sp.]
MSNNKYISLAFSFVLLSLLSHNAFATPILQLYIEGGTYDVSTESWVMTPAGSSGGAPFVIWTIGNTAGSGGKGTIFDVKLSIAYDKSIADPNITITHTKIGSGSGSFQGFNDLNASIAPVLTTVAGATVGTSNGNYTVGSDEVVDNGSSPLLSDGRALGSHDVYGAGIVWKEFALGDFSETGDTLGDFMSVFPESGEQQHGAAQINAYQVSVTGGHGLTLHIDLYDSIEAKNHSQTKFAPFSHDAIVDADVTVAPEPATMAIWGMLTGFATLFGYRKRKLATATA